jgi:hypothetical protein
MNADSSRTHTKTFITLPLLPRQANQGSPWLTRTKLQPGSGCLPCFLELNHRMYWAVKHFGEPEPHPAIGFSLDIPIRFKVKADYESELTNGEAHRE